MKSANGTAPVKLEQTSARPPVYVVTCFCGVKTEEVGDQVYAVQLWEAHAEQAGHEGAFPLVAVNLRG